MKVKQSIKIPYKSDEVTRAARQEIDDEINELERRLRCLRMKRNELAPISVLPPEVLSRIFIAVRDLSTHGPYVGSTSSSHPATWMYTGYVCHHWREIALDCSNLWSIPVFARPDLAQEMIRRSKMAPLTIRSLTDAFTPKVLEQLENALAQVTRVRSIELALGNSSQRPRTIFSLLSQPAPLLENITLSGQVCDHSVTLPLDTLPDAPRLQRIEICTLKLSWESSIFKHTTLTELRLRNTLVGATTMGRMMNTLHHLPNLRILALINSISPHMTDDGNLKIPEFLFLERLELGDKATNCTFFLRHIRYPPRTVVKLISLSTEVEDVMIFISLLGQNMRRGQSIEVETHRSPFVVRSARFTSDTDFSEIAFFNSVDGMNKFNVDPNILVCCDSDFSFNRAWGPFLTSVANYFDLSSLESLLLGWKFADNHIRAIQDSLGKLPKLKVINITQSLPEICSALAGFVRGEKQTDNAACDPLSNQEIPQRDHPPIIFFPALETLTVQDMSFQQSHQQHPDIVDHLINILIERSNINAPIDNLRLERCREVRTWQKRLLGELVVHLSVDGEVVDVGALESRDGSDDDSTSSE